MQHRLLPSINSMQLKNTLGRIHTNARNIPHGRSPLLEIFATSFWHVRCRRGAVHTNTFRSDALEVEVRIVRYRRQPAHAVAEQRPERWPRFYSGVPVARQGILRPVDLAKIV